MKTTYFCHSHAAKVMLDESFAYSSWREMMRRGWQAYERCSTNAIEVYFISAIEIALIRIDCSQNTYFDESFLVKPLEALVDYLLAQNDYNQAISLLSRVSEEIQPKVSEHYLNTIELLYTKIEKEEKAFFMKCKNKPEANTLIPIVKGPTMVH